MSQRSFFIAFSLLTICFLASAGPAFCDRSMYLGLCQEIVNNARSYEARANYHNQIAKSLMAQIENFAKLPKNSATAQAVDNLFASYEENRAMERKFLDLYRKSSLEADKCMQSAQ